MATTQTFKYVLDRSSKKFHCPDCRKKSLVRFIDIDKQYADEQYGRCDREVNCGYFQKPPLDDAGGEVFERSVYVEPETSYIQPHYATNTFRGYDQNNLTKYLISLVGETRVQQLISQYRFGVDQSSPYTKDWTLFWQFDGQNRIRSAKMIRYKEDGHRDKDWAASWFHSKGDINGPLFPEFHLKQCLFGEHLLSNTRKPIAVVESEKTALIASLFIDKYTWVACGGLQELRADKVAVLKNRSVTVFPDLGAYDNWAIKAEDFGFNISDHLEKIATDEDRKAGKDLADFLIK